MERFVVERHLVGWMPGEVDDLLEQIERARPAMAAVGVHYLGSVVLPTDEICFDLFDAPDTESLAAANERHRLPADRMLPARTSAVAVPA
jgi:hypothetical protein